jgi:hypothetical protein
LTDKLISLAFMDGLPMTASTIVDAVVEKERK